MSVINKMLKDLDKRGASPGRFEGAAQDAANLSPPAQSARRWRIPAWLLIVPIAIGAVLLALWLWPESPEERARSDKAARLAQLKPVPVAEAPRPLAAPPETKAAETPPKPEETPPKVAETPSPKAAPITAPPAPAATAPAAQASLPSAAKAPPSLAPAEKAEREAPKMVEPAPAPEPKFERRAPERKDGTITISKRPPAAAPGVAEQKPAPKPSAKPVATKPAAPAPRETTEPPATTTAAASGAVAAASKAPAPPPDTSKSSISIERPDRDSTRSELAAREFRSAVELMNQGRVELALGTYASVLRLDPKHVAARQTMVVLLMERSRVAEAQSVLRDGLQALPEHTEWAMLLARIQVNAGDAAGAFETLDRALPYAKDRPDYHAFVGTVLQMQGRHKEAIAHYEIAVRLSPGSGRWLTGLAISLEEEKRVPEARDTYSRALATRTLGPDLQAFVERKLGQLQ